MIDTILISQKLLPEEVDTIFKCFSFHKEEREDCYVTHDFWKYGISSMYLKKYKTKKYVYNAIELRINPRQMISSDVYPDIIQTPGEVSNFIKSFNKFIHDFKAKCMFSVHSIRSFEHWKALRVGFAIDIRTPFVDLYVDLAQRGDKFWFLTEQYIAHLHRRGQKEGSCYYYSKQYLSFLMYNKYYERINKKKKVTEPFKDILRIEVQCSKRKLKQIKKSLNLPSMSPVHFMTEEISYMVINKYYNKIIGRGDYYSLKKAIEILNGSQYTINRKNHLIDCIQGINKKRSIWKTREMLTDQKEIQEFNQNIKDTNYINVNPVTIPNRKKCDYLINPIKLKQGV